MNRVVVIGGGASGLMAAITAAREGAAVTILEAMEKPGKKILITGNGRCNLTNKVFSREDCYRSSSKFPWKRVLEQFSEEDTINFFQGIGLLTHERNGGIYPLTDQSSSVTDLLLAEARRRKVKIKCNEKAEYIQRNRSGYLINTNSWQYETDQVILSCGSKSYAQTGSDGSGYRICEKLDIKMIEPLPALVPLVIKENFVAKLSGVRSNARVVLKISKDNCIVSEQEEYGEVQWTDYGVSGIVIFQLSRYAVKALKEQKKVSLFIDIIPTVSRDELFTFIIRRNGSVSISEVLTGILPKKMVPVILQLAGIKADAKLETMKEEEIYNIISQMKGIVLTVRGSKSFDMAQVCQGGVSISEINIDTMEVKKYPGIYITGELLDIDGICGGYNLQWAWSTGYIAGKASANKEI